MSVNQCEKCRNYADDGLRVDENGFHVCARGCGVDHEVDESKGKLMYFIKNAFTFEVVFSTRWMLVAALYAAWKTRNGDAFVIDYTTKEITL